MVQPHARSRDRRAPVSWSLKSWAIREAAEDGGMPERGDKGSIGTKCVPFDVAPPAVPPLRQQSPSAPPFRTGFNNPLLAEPRRNCLPHMAETS